MICLNKRLLVRHRARWSTKFAIRQIAVFFFGNLAMTSVRDSLVSLNKLTSCGFQSLFSQHDEMSTVRVKWDCAVEYWQRQRIFVAQEQATKYVLRLHTAKINLWQFWTCFLISFHTVDLCCVYIWLTVSHALNVVGNDTICSMFITDTVCIVW